MVILHPRICPVLSRYVKLHTETVIYHISNFNLLMSQIRQHQVWRGKAVWLKQMQRRQAIVSICQKIVSVLIQSSSHLVEARARWILHQQLHQLWHQTTLNSLSPWNRWKDWWSRELKSKVLQICYIGTRCYTCYELIAVPCECSRWNIWQKTLGSS